MSITALAYKYEFAVLTAIQMSQLRRAGTHEPSGEVREPSDQDRNLDKHVRIIAPYYSGKEPFTYVIFIKYLIF